MINFSFLHNQIWNIHIIKNVSTSDSNYFQIAKMKKMNHKITLSFLMMFFTLSLLAQQRTITGYVYNESKEVLIGANIVEKGTDNGITTDYVGFFEITVPVGEVELEVSYTGYQTKKVIVRTPQKHIEVILKSDEVLLDAVVIADVPEEPEPEPIPIPDEIIDVKDYEDIRMVKEEGARREKERASRAKAEAKAMATYEAEVTSSAVVASVSAAKAKKKRGRGKESTAMTPPPPPPPPPAYVPAEPEIAEPTIAYEDVMIDMDAVKEVEVLSGEEEIFMTGGGGTGSAELPKAGQLTAGILNDYGKWNLWQDIQENELKKWQESWSIRPWDRYPVQLTTQNGYPIVNAKVKLMDGGKAIWAARTDNTGRAELWANLYEDKEARRYTIQIEYKGESYSIDDAKSFHEGGNARAIPIQCDISKIVDIAFVVDATGSMGDEINYLKSELTDVITRSKDALKDVDLRLGSVFYRDLGDAYVTRKSHFSKDINKTVDFIKKQGASGGGDGPEAIEEAFDEALDNLAWSEDAAARLMFLVLDAPPHQTDAIKARLKVHIERAASMGIRVIPVACSGTDRSTEYLMRSFALATNGSYIYLTDDSGIGGSHQKPITDEHNVNMLNDLLVQTITDFASTVSCEEQLDYIAEEIQDTMEVALVLEKQVDTDDPEKEDIIKETEFSWKYYPNPCGGQLWVEIEGELEHLYLFDGAGKLLRRIDVTDSNLELDLSMYASGMYYLRGMGKDGREVSGKVVLTRTY